MTSLQSLSNHIHRFLDNDWDYIAAVSGNAGVGKSTMVCQLGPLVDKRFTFDHNNIYSQKELNEAIYEYPSKSFINVDEAINVLYKRDFAKGGQKKLLKDFDMIRDRNLCVFFLVPDFWDLDKKILNSGRIKIWIHVDQRGVAYIFKPDNNPFNPDKWNRDLNRKLLYDWSHVHPRKSPNFVEEIKFQPMAAEDYALYKEVKAKKRKAASKENENDDPEEVNVKAMQVYALKDAGISINAIAKQLHMGNQTILSLLKDRQAMIDKESCQTGN